MIFKIICCIFLVSLHVGLLAQKVSDAEALFNKGQYEDAYSIYEKLIDSKPKDALLHYKAGRTLIAAKEWDERGVQHFIVSAKKKYYKSYYYLGLIYFRQYKFVESVENFDLYKELRGERFTEVDSMHIDSCMLLSQMGVSMIQRVEDVAIVDSTIYSKKEFFNAYRLSTDLGIIEYFDNVFPRGTSKTTDDAGIFMPGRKNIMIFSQDKGERKQYDLQLSDRLIDGWAPAKNLSNVLNTPKDENFPFVLPDGVTIYFASKGHNSLGGYDIFFSRYNTSYEDYTQPLNIGMPFNSPYNDYMLVIDEMAQVGWFATDRRQAEDSVVVYEFIPNKERTLLSSRDIDEIRSLAQLKTYRKAVYNKGVLDTDDALVGDIVGEVEINFLVNDTLSYTRMDQFRSEEARDLYLKFVDMDKKIVTNTRLLEGKRREYMLTKDKLEQQVLYKEILELEDNVFKYTDLMKEFLFKTRRAEGNVLRKYNMKLNN